MAADRELLVATLRGELGYQERLTNRNKFAQDLDANFHNVHKFWRDGSPWCAVFAAWAYWVACGKPAEWPLPILGFTCRYDVEDWKKAGRWGAEPQVGAMAYFHGPRFPNWHVETVVAVDADGTVVTVGGNVHDAVREVRQKRGDGRFEAIVGFGYPEFADSSSVDWAAIAAMDRHYRSVIFPGRSFGPGETGVHVEAVQWCLHAFTSGQVAVTGRFDLATESAVRWIQALNGRNVTGRVGLWFWSALKLPVSPDDLP